MFMVGSQAISCLDPSAQSSANSVASALHYPALFRISNDRLYHNPMLQAVNNAVRYDGQMLCEPNKIPASPKAMLTLMSDWG